MYKRQIQGHLEKLEVELKNYQAPPVDKDLNKRLDVVQAERLAEVRESKRFLEELEGDVQVVKSYLERLERLPAYEDITVEEYFALFPEEKERIFKEIEQDNWGTSSSPDATKQEGH